MTTTINARVFSQIQYAINQADGNRSILDSDVTQNASEYTYGTGNFQATNVVKTTGVLTPSSSTVFDLQAFPSNVFGVAYNVNFSRIKSIVVHNTASLQGYDLSVQATGTNPQTDIFNGGSGNIVVKPYSSYSYNDPYNGINISLSNSKLSIHDIGGSGTTYSITLLGVV